MPDRAFVLATILCLSGLLSCGRKSAEMVDNSHAADSVKVVSVPLAVYREESVEDFDKSLAVFESVFWDPRDTESLRRLIRDTSLVKDKTILEIGTGSGLVALCCLKAGAARVVATDVNPAAVKNAKYNAAQLGFSDRLDVRQVSLSDTSAYSTIKENEKFDFVISNPPWENLGATPRRMKDFALYDSDFALLKSLLSGLKSHLKPDGSAFVAYGCVTAINKLEQHSAEFGLKSKRWDDRDLTRLHEVFLPGMLVEVAP